MNRQDYQALRERIESLVDPDYQLFQQKLVPTVNNLLGVRIPVLRKLAVELAAGDWRGYLAAARADSYEEAMLQGMVIARAKMSPTERIELIEAFLPRVDNWAVCDIFCGELKFAAKNQPQLLELLLRCADKQETFSVRFATVMLMQYYLDDAYFKRSLRLFVQMDQEEYYIAMAVAWAISVCFVKHRTETLALLQQGALRPRTQRMALQKIVESRQVSAEDKQLMRTLRATIPASG